jgi:pyruvate/2-oxoglutarate dehydrogenase complex dihydrolipoamide dehydrogenase (E3) component
LYFQGRDPEISPLQLDKAGVEMDPNSKKIIVDENERTSVANIYGIGDVIHVCLLLLRWSLVAQ